MGSEMCIRDSIIIGMFAIATIVGLRIPARYSLPLLAYLWYLAQTDSPSGVYFPVSIETAIFLFVLLLVAWAVGWILRAFLITRERQADRLKAELERERERTVKALHGSVASSLTSVVLRSEALAMSGDDQTAKAAKLIAEDARRSMQEVRQLIRFMRSDDPATLNEDTATRTPSLSEALRSFSDTCLLYTSPSPRDS